MIRPFVQGDSELGRQRARSFILILTAAHVSTATLTVFVLSQLGQLVSGVLSTFAVTVILGVASVAGLVVDIVAAARGRMSLGLRRQTAKELAHTTDTWWVTPLLWGGDTGIIGTTYRVSFTSWVVLLAALTGAAPPWLGAVYGLAFAIPLILSVSLGDPTSTGLMRSQRMWTNVRGAQMLGIVVMLALPLWTAWTW
ncbi:hypothetical protein ABZ912_09165 [Nonomuraea angiospora]|uniref:hypothetical protein n=1 Tax=Nonomuraea angiospora TaxID=46172 RepID=UPI0033C95CCC